MSKSEQNLLRYKSAKPYLGLPVSPSSVYIYWSRVDEMGEIARRKKNQSTQKQDGDHYMLSIRLLKPINIHDWVHSSLQTKLLR